MGKGVGTLFSEEDIRGLSQIEFHMLNVVIMLTLDPSPYLSVIHE